MAPDAESADRPATTGSLKPYVVAVAATAAATALTALFWPANRNIVFALYYLAVIASAIYGSRRAAILAIVLSALSVWYFFLPPYYSFRLTIEASYALSMFALVSSMIIALIERLKASQQTVREAEELFRKAFHSNPSGLAIARVSDGRFVEANEAFAAMTGFTRQEVIGSTAVEMGLLSAPARQSYVDELIGKNSFLDREVVAHNRTGEERQLLVSCERISLRGQPHVVAIFNDVTDRKREREQLLENAALLRVAGRVATWSSTSPLSP